MRWMGYWVLGLVLTWTLPAQGEDWPQWMGPQRDGVWREQGLIEKFPASGPKVRWRVPVGAGYSGPAIAQGKVYLTDRILDPGISNPDNPFDRTTRVKGKDRVLCLDEKTGELLWKYEYPSIYQVSYSAGPRTTPLVAGDKVYTLGTMGELLCLDTSSGKVLWSKDFIKEYKAPIPGWGWSASPLLDGNRLICLAGGDGSVAVAFDKDTGKELWRKLSAKEIGYCPPVIYNISGKRQLIIWHPESANGLDPETGEVFWTQPYPDRKFIKAALTVSMPRFFDKKLYFTAFYDGHMLLGFDAGPTQPKVLYRSKGRSEQPEETDGLHSIMPTPFIKDGTIYGVCSYGELRGLKASTGERLWETHQATTGGKSIRWGNAFLVEAGDRFVLFNEQGDLILAKLSPKGYEELSRARIVEPINTMAKGRKVVWSHPGFANRCAFVRNDRELVCVSLAKD